MIKITGYTPKFTRIITGWHSFDWALADQDETGYPLGQINEIYGSNGVGKSTFAQSLAFILAKETTSNISLADFEGINEKLMVANAETQCFDGEVHRIQDIKDEAILQEFLDDIKSKNYSVGIVDAVGSISPVSEQDGDLGDSNMGRRAFLMAQFSRRTNHVLINNTQKSVLFINHQHQRIGGIGTITPGGETKKYNASIRIQLTRCRYKNKEMAFPDGSYVLEGKVIKNRWGLEDRKFHIFMLAGKGAHKGLTAMWDCIMLKTAEWKKTISLGDKSFGYMKDLTDKAQAKDDKFFLPFAEALKSVTITEEVTENEEGSAENE